MQYDDYMDKECIPLCDALNELPLLETFESCCGHLKERFSVWFFCEDIYTISRLGRCVERNYSDGKWELLVDSTDTHPLGVFWLRTKAPFGSYEEMDESTSSLIKNIKHWFLKEFDEHFRLAGQGEARVVDVKEDAGGYPYITKIELYDYDKEEPLFKEGDKVVVQIRKK